MPAWHKHKKVASNFLQSEALGPLRNPSPRHASHAATASDPELTDNWEACSLQDKGQGCQTQGPHQANSPEIETDSHFASLHAKTKQDQLELPKNRKARLNQIGQMSGNTTVT